MDNEIKNIWNTNECTVIQMEDSTVKVEGKEVLCIIRDVRKKAVLDWAMFLSGLSFGTIIGVLSFFIGSRF